MINTVHTKTNDLMRNNLTTRREREDRGWLVLSRYMFCAYAYVRKVRSNRGAPGKQDWSRLQTPCLSRLTPGSAIDSSQIDHALRALPCVHVLCRDAEKDEGVVVTTCLTIFEAARGGSALPEETGSIRKCPINF